MVTCCQRKPIRFSECFALYLFQRNGLWVHVLHFHIQQFLCRCNYSPIYLFRLISGFLILALIKGSVQLQRDLFQSSAHSSVVPLLHRKIHLFSDRQTDQKVFPGYSQWTTWPYFQAPTQAHFQKASQLMMNQCTKENHTMPPAERHQQDPPQKAFNQNKQLNQLSLLRSFSTACRLSDFFVLMI